MSSSITQTEAFDQLLAKIKTLRERVWDGKCDWLSIKDWLNQFDGATGEIADTEQLHMLYLLSNFMYFGSIEIRELLRSLYRDVFRYQIVESVRRNNGNTTDREKINQLYMDELLKTRFLPVGNPSESGSHLLYFFRQENHLSKKQFISVHDVFEAGNQNRLRDYKISRYVFLDDLCGSGEQGEKYCRDVVSFIKKIDGSKEVFYYVLFATSEGINKVNQAALFDRVNCVLELDETFKAFVPESRFFTGSQVPVDKRTALNVALTYGKELQPALPLGYRDGQLLIGFNHNIPDNTLPVFWHNETKGKPWNPIFPRYPKIYEWAR